jgi:hypothetical protein
MKKFDAFEAHLIERGLKDYIDLICNDIVEAEKNDRRPIMTVPYIRGIELEVLAKLKSLTLKQK